MAVLSGDLVPAQEEGEGGGEGGGGEAHFVLDSGLSVWMSLWKMSQEVWSREESELDLSTWEYLFLFTQVRVKRGTHGDPDFENIVTALGNCGLETVWVGSPVSSIMDLTRPRYWHFEKFSDCWQQRHHETWI